MSEITGADIPFYKRLGKNSFFYVVTNILQKGVAFLLLPVYTRFLSPEDYGILAVVGAISGTLFILFSLCLNGAMTRYYFSYKNEPELLKEFWGTNITFMIIVTLVVGIIFLFFGERLLSPHILGNIPYWPFMALGVATLVFQPVATTLISLLQVKEEAFNYSIFALLQFVIQVSIILSLIVIFRWGAEGPLFAALVTNALFYFIALYYFRNEYRICLKPKHLKLSLRYSVPLVPHSLSCQITSVTDRLFINNMLSTGFAGIYNIGFLFGSIITIVADNINRAYVPISMSTYEAGRREKLDELKRLGFMLIVAYCLLASTMSIFAAEIIRILTTYQYYESYRVVPFISFAFAASGIYLVFVNVLFFYQKTTKYIGICTFLGAVTNIVLNYILILNFNFIGAAIATLIAQILVTVTIGYLGSLHEQIKWDYGKIILIFFLSFIIVLISTHIPIDNRVIHFVVKVISLGGVYVALNYIAWNDFNYLGKTGFRMFQKLIFTAT